MQPQPEPAVTKGVPRRWNATLDGIVWLPRMIDKAEMKRAGRLGNYVLGHSVVDAALLNRLGLTTAQFEAIVDRLPNDAAVLSALRARGFDEAGVRRWSERFADRYRWRIHAWDIDEGYAKPNPAERVLLAIWRRVERPVMNWMRRRPAP